MVYIVKSVVCDYGVFEVCNYEVSKKTKNKEKLIVICNSLSNANLIADILNADLKHTKYEECNFNDGYDKGFEDGLFAVLDDIKTEYYEYFERTMTGGNQNETSK